MDALKTLLAEREALYREKNLGSFHSSNRPTARSDGRTAKKCRGGGWKIKSLKNRLWRRDQLGGMILCHWCSREMDKKTFTLDHLIPLGRDGTNSLQNLVAACSPCNGRRADSLPPDIDAIVREQKHAKNRRNKEQKKRVKALKKARLAAPLTFSLANAFPA